MTIHPRFQDQLALEEEMRSMGITRYRETLAAARKVREEASTQPVRRLMDTAHGKMVAALQAFVDAASSGRAGPKHAALKFILMVGDLDMVSHLAIKGILDGVSRRQKLPAVASVIATLIEDELHFRQFEEQVPAGFKFMHNVASKTGNARRRRNVMLEPARKMGVELDEMSPRDKVLLGTKLVELFVQATGLVAVVRSSEGSANTPYYVEPTAATVEWLTNENNQREWLMPVYLPTLIPPKPWTSPFEGGYWSNRVRRLTLVKTRNRAYLNELAKHSMPDVYAAVNALQDTAWSVNTRVLDVMEELWRSKSKLAKLPSQETKDELMPERPDWLRRGMTMDEMTEDQRIQFGRWKQGCSVAYTALATSKTKVIAFARMLQVARRFRDEGEFYFPHQLDWRGRIYPASLFLTPQGSDPQRGLLQFANTVPLTDDDGVRWLAVHGAGLWGVDKVDMEHRITWVEEHSEEICAAARDPFENRFWTEAEKPWQALAFCFDWLGWKTEGYAYESSLPVQMDGTCNGLQNFSAILRDAIGGAAVNLVPADKPQDIYGRVAEIVMKMIEADLDKTECIKINRKDENGKSHEVDGPTIGSVAAGWHGHVNRKVTKRPVMTLAYGARQFGFIEQVFEDTVTPWKNEHPETFPWEGTGWVAARYMGSLIWTAVQQVVVAAAQAMDWLQQAARITAKEGLPVNWTTPTGFLVQQAYRLPDFKRIELTFDEVRIRLSIDTSKEDAQIDTRRQASGISPNWVHSLDAAHMSRTIRRCHELGMRSFSFIHDSYGTHAANAYVLAQALREEFVAQYTPDVIGKFRDELQSQLPEGTTLPALPPKGTLDLQLVLESPFFFAGSIRPSIGRRRLPPTTAERTGRRHRPSTTERSSPCTTPTRARSGRPSPSGAPAAASPSSWPPG